jgi:hypothetical protein
LWIELPAKETEDTEMRVERDAGRWTRDGSSRILRPEGGHGVGDFFLEDFGDFFHSV